MIKVCPASLQVFIDTPNCVLEDRVQHSTPSVIPNCNYVIMVGVWNCLKYFCVFFVLLLSGEQRLFYHPVYQQI
jgi:hypothetical protein